MSTTPALAATPDPGGVSGFLAGPFGSIAFLLPMGLLFWLLIFRPQQQARRRHAEMVGGIKRGDTVVLSSGIVGKVTKVDDAEAHVEIAPSVNVKVVKVLITEVRARPPPASANDKG